MAKRTEKERKADRQLEGVIDLLYFLVLRKLTGVSRARVEDFIQDMALRFWLRLQTGTIQDPRKYLYIFVRGECADFWNPKKYADDFNPRGKYPYGFSEERAGTRSLSAPLSIRSGRQDPDAGGAKELRWTLDNSLGGPRWDEPDVIVENATISRAIRQVLDDDPCGEMWRRKAMDMTYVEIGKALGLTGPQVRGRMARSKPRLQKRLREAGICGSKK